VTRTQAFFLALLALMVWTALLMCLAVLAGGCGAAVGEVEVCERVPPEQEPKLGLLRCTPSGELQELDCGGWRTLLVCDKPELCRTGAGPGCLAEVGR
jgi:hypothetical protein